MPLSSIHPSSTLFHTPPFRSLSDTLSPFLVVTFTHAHSISNQNTLPHPTTASLITARSACSNTQHHPPPYYRLNVCEARVADHSFRK